MKRQEPISNVMSSKVECADVNDKLSVVRHLLLSGSFHHVPIVDGRKLVGMISSRDMLKLPFDVDGMSDEATDDGIDKSFTIDQVMHRELVTIDQDETVQTAIDLLAKGKFHSLPVVDEDECLVGIVTSIDLLAYLMA